MRGAAKVKACVGLAGGEGDDAVVKVADAGGHATNADGIPHRREGADGTIVVPDPQGQPGDHAVAAELGAGLRPDQPIGPPNSGT